MISSWTYYADDDMIGHMSNKKTDLAKQLRVAFRRSGLSRFALARRSGVSYSCVHRFIGGDRDVTATTLSKLADVLGLELRAKKAR